MQAQGAGHERPRASHARRWRDAGRAGSRPGAQQPVRARRGAPGCRRGCGAHHRSRGGVPRPPGHHRRGHAGRDRCRSGSGAGSSAACGHAAAGECARASGSDRRGRGALQRRLRRLGGAGAFAAGADTRGRGCGGARGCPPLRGGRHGLHRRHRGQLRTGGARVASVLRRARRPGRRRFRGGVRHRQGLGTRRGVPEGASRKRRGRAGGHPPGRESACAVFLRRRGLRRCGGTGPSTGHAPGGDAGRTAVRP